MLPNGCLVFSRGAIPARFLWIPMVREWVSFVAAFLPLVLAALAPEDRCLGNLPIGLDDVEVHSVKDLSAGDQVAAIAAPE